MLSASFAETPTATTPGDSSGNVVFRNTDRSVAYVGSKSCGASGCHQEIARDYPATPMGHSMAPANTPLELARVPQPITVLNPKNNRYYQVYQQGGSLYQTGYELDKKGRKLYSVTHKLDYVVGGGLTGYSYLFRIGPWLFQAPLSYYSNSGQWELSPGYNVDDIGFTRKIGTGCLLCHNGQPEGEPNRDGKYKDPAFRFGEEAISCETCHGPGEPHVREMQTRKTDLLGPREIDTSIVNPAKLSPRLADDLCRDCHQLGDAVVLLPGKNYMDYRPGTPLSQTWAFVKRPVKEQQRDEANRLEALPPVRGSLEPPLWWKNSSLELSKCYQATHGRLTCITCHSIHHGDQPEDKVAFYRNRCLACHNEKSCKLALDDPARVGAANNCIDCHMERRAVAGIAHSNDTKHRIVRYPGQPLPDVAFEQPKPDLPGLLWLNRPEGSSAPLPDLTQLEAYWTVAAKDPTLAPYLFERLDRLSKAAPNEPVVLTCLGAVALSGKKDNAKAAGYFSRALQHGSEEPSTYINLATALENMGRHQEAEATLERGVAAYPYWGPLVARLAQQYENDGQDWRARVLIQQYGKDFAEDPTVREALQQMKTVTTPDLSAPIARPVSTGQAR